MPRRFDRCFRWHFLLLITSILSGCMEDNPQGLSVVRPSGQLVAGEKVLLLREEGDFAFIQCSDGRKTFVARGLVKHRNTGEEMLDKSYTHSIVRDAPTFAKLPSLPPAALEPRTLDAIDREQGILNGLYLSEHSSKEVIAPRNVPKFLVDQETGERCWHAYECTHPNCPGPKTAGREHFIFAHTQHDSQEAIHCPACLKIRNLATETKEQWGLWGNYVRPYELPETLRRRGELDAERRRTIEAIRSGALPPTP